MEISEKSGFSKNAFDVFPTSPRIEIDPRESVSRFHENHENLKIMEICEKSGFSKNPFEGQSTLESPFLASLKITKN